MSEKKQLLIGAGILLVIMAICFAALISGQGSVSNPVTSPSAYSNLDPRVRLTQAVATITLEDVTLTIPPPAGYCFVDPKEDPDRALIDIMTNMQTSFGNHLWLAYANCDQLKAVRISRDMNAYMDTGMLVTPNNFTEKKTSSSEFTSFLRTQLKSLNPVAFENMINSATHANMSPTLDIKSGQPVIFSDNADDLIFLLRHNMAEKDIEPLALTEFDIVTAIREQALVAIFTFKDVADPTPQQNFSKTYLAKLRAANPPLEDIGDAPDLH